MFWCLVRASVCVCVCACVRASVCVCVCVLYFFLSHHRWPALQAGVCGESNSIPPGALVTKQTKTPRRTTAGLSREARARARAEEDATMKAMHDYMRKKRGGPGGGDMGGGAQAPAPGAPVQAGPLGAAGGGASAAASPRSAPRHGGDVGGRGSTPPVVNTRPFDQLPRV